MQILPPFRLIFHTAMLRFDFNFGKFGSQKRFHSSRLSLEKLMFTDEFFSASIIFYDSDERSGFFKTKLFLSGEEGIKIESIWT
jgi:hypothetical protein